MSDPALGLLGMAMAFIAAWFQLNLTPFCWWESKARYMATNTIASCAVIALVGLISGRSLLGVSVLALGFAVAFLSLVTIRAVVAGLRGPNGGR